MLRRNAPPRATGPGADRGRTAATTFHDRAGAQPRASRRASPTRAPTHLRLTGVGSLSKCRGIHLRAAWHSGARAINLDGIGKRLRSATGLHVRLKMSFLARRASDRRPPSGRARGPLVLVIEDTMDLRDLFAAELATDGFLVIDAVDGETGVEKARRFEPDGNSARSDASRHHRFRSRADPPWRRAHPKCRDRRRDRARIAASPLNGTRCGVRCIPEQTRARSSGRRGANASPRQGNRSGPS